MNKRIWVYAALLPLVVGGCATSSQPKCGVYNDVSQFQNVGAKKAIEARLDTKPYQMKIKPIVESRQDDAKVVFDAGKILRVWVAPYKIKGTLIAAHDIYVMVQKPDFIVGESVPNPRDRRGLQTPVSNFPFVFRDSEMDPENEKMDSKTIKRYLNNVYKAQKDSKYIIEKNDEAESKFDKTIKEYIKEQK